MSSDVTKDRSLLLITSFEMFNHMWIHLAFCYVEHLYFKDNFGMPPAVYLHKQMAISSPFNSQQLFCLK